MAGNKPALYAAGVTALGLVCFGVAAAAVGIPVWAYYDYPTGGWDSEKGYFNPWRVCKQLSYNREKCGGDVSKFKPTLAVYVAGLVASSSAALLGVFCILSVIQIAMISSRDKIVMKYNSLIILKLALALLAALLAIIAACLFAVQTDDDRNGVRITRGLSFYLQILVIVLTILLLIMSVYDMLYARRAGGDPTQNMDMNPTQATTYNNPGFRERPTNGAGVSVTDSSGKPYSGSSVTNGSMASMNTTLTSMSNGSTLDSVTRSPLRSSLKKPKPRDPLGIQNPGYSGSAHSPTFQRNGSVKKVRIQTHSTEV